MVATSYSRTLKKRELQEVEDNKALYTSHGNYAGGSSGGGHGHATSYQYYMLSTLLNSMLKIIEHYNCCTKYLK